MTTDSQPVSTDASARPGKRVALAILLSMSAIYFFSFFQRVAVPGTIFDELQSTFRTSAALVTGLSSLYLYIYGGMQFIAGVLNDRFGAARVMLACGLLMGIGSLLFPLAPSLPWLYAARALVGLGASLAFICIVKELDYLFYPREFATYLGIAMFLGYAGGLTGTFPFEFAVRQFGWRPPLLVAGVLCLLAFVAALLLFRRTGSLARRIDAPSPLVFGVILRNRASLALIIAGPINFSVYFLIQSTIGKKFLVDYCGISPSAASVFTFVMMLTTMGIIVASGFLTRAIGHRRKPLIIVAIATALLSLCLSLVGLYAGLGAGWFLACYMLLALSNLGSPTANTLMKELNPPEAVGTATGVINGLCYITVAVLTTLAGVVMDHFRAGSVTTATAVIYPREAYMAIFAISAVLSLGSLVCAFFLHESYGRSVFQRQQEQDGTLT